MLWNQNFTIENRTPFKKIDTTLITIIDNDSIPVRFEVKQDTLFNRYEFLVNLEEDMQYPDWKFKENVIARQSLIEARGIQTEVIEMCR